MISPSPTTESHSPSVPPPSTRVSMASQADVGAPRECRVMERYLPDPSLRYNVLPFGAGAFRRFLPTLGAWCGSIAGFSYGLGRVLSREDVLRASLLMGLSICIFLLASFWIYKLAPRVRQRAFFARSMRPVEIGLDRAIFQPGTSFRYELHLTARRPVELRGVHIRLVFWESWRARRVTKIIPISLWVEQKQGHDLVRQQLGGIVMGKGTHAVVRGEMTVPTGRPTEHHRGKRKHVSYVNVTTTLLVMGHRPSPVFRIDCPQLITFPWM